MIEKYAVDLTEIPPTDDQIRVLKKLYLEVGEDFCMPKTASEAEEEIKDMQK